MYARAVRVRIGGHGSRVVELGGWYESLAGALRFETVALALLFLRREVDGRTVLQLRARLAERDWTAHRLSDAAVLQKIAEALHGGALAASIVRGPVYTAEAEVAGVTKHVVLPAPPPRVNEPEDAPLAPAPELALFPAMNAAAQVGTLRAAASRATPFCEVCTQPPPVFAPFAAAQAGTLRAAARNAAPLCEICDQGAGDELVEPPARAAAQAATLRAAASKASPFCEICEGPA